MSSCSESSCNSFLRKSQNDSFHIYWMYSLWLTITSIHRLHVNFLWLEKTKIRIKTFRIVIHGDYHSQNSCRKENSSHLRTDESRWVQNLENIHDDSIRWSLYGVRLVTSALSWRSSTSCLSFSRIEERNRWRSDA